MKVSATFSISEEVRALCKKLKFQHIEVNKAVEDVIIKLAAKHKIK